MKRTRLNKIGKVGKSNIEARKLIAQKCEELQLNSCEIQLEECLGSFAVAPAHRHKRAWYQGDVELLSDYNQWVGACVNCHNTIEHDKELTEDVFERLRTHE